MMAKNPYQGDDVDPFSGARDEEGGIKREAPKKRVVTKEEMRKAGFENLRDFLNAERGLTRRVVFPSKSAEKGPDKATLDRVAAKQRDEDKGPDKATVDRIARKAKEEAKGPSEADIDRMAKKFDTKKDRPGSEVIAEKQEKAQPKMQGAYREAFGNIKKALGFKSGGSVSSASKRADGIAMKGKTKGRIV
jgi:hypothetical protein